MVVPDTTAPSTPFGYTDHVHFETRRIIAGEPVTIDGHTFLVQSIVTDSSGYIRSPHLGGKQDAFGIVGRVTLKLEHAPWRRCPAVDDAPPADVSALVEIPRGAYEDLVRVAEYVSIGRTGVNHQPDGSPYPDRAARRALGSLDAAGLLPTGGENE